MDLILDTSVLSSLFTGDPALAAVLAGEERHHLPVIVLGEYRYGLLRSSGRRRLERLLASLARESVILRVEEETAATYAVVREELRRAGRPIPENDVWIAALARQHGQCVVSRDAHFDAVDGISRVGW